MSKRNKKASRNENLIVLSHEHHHGLIFCNRLKKGVGIDGKILKAYILDFWENYLVAHFANEELVFLPYLNGEELTLQFLEEHRVIRVLVEKIELGEGDISEQSLQFATLVYDHIRFEERQFFPWLEVLLTTEQLSKVGEVFENMDIIAHDFSPQFWE